MNKPFLRSKLASQDLHSLLAQPCSNLDLRESGEKTFELRVVCKAVNFINSIRLRRLLENGSSPPRDFDHVADMWHG